MKVTIFYSWQSDRPSKCNKDGIHQAAEMAIQRIASDDQITLEPSLDRDTKDVPGSPDVANTILQKIERAGLFLCDVSVITDKGVKRPMPNPNVLIELGYAAAKLGWHRIICVMNQEYGGPTKLPFDLQTKRWPVLYRLAENAPDDKVTEELGRLSEGIEQAIRVTIQSGILTPAVNPKDRRVAVKFYQALNTFEADIHSFFQHAGLENPFGIFRTSVEDDPNTHFPPSSLVDPIISALQNTSFKAGSNLQVGDKTLTWAGAFQHGLLRLTQECDRILDQYADRDDSLISLIDLVSVRGKQLSFFIHASMTNESLAHLYDNGVPDAHIDWFRWFFLILTKAYSVVRQFYDPDAK